MTGYFITGTDTGAGKTYVTSRLARRARAKGRKVFAFKPIETGCEPGELGPDQQLICEAAGGWQSGELRGLYQLGHPAAPWVSADAEHKAIELDQIADLVRQGSALADVTLVEGAGGWRVPLSKTADIGSLARHLELPILIVARATLGTINHSLLTIEAVERDGCRVGALVISRRLDEDLAFAKSNIEQIHRRWGGKIVLCVGDGEALDALL